MLTVQVFDSSAMGYMLADLSHKLAPENGGGGLRFSTDQHGFSACEMPFLPMPLDEAFQVYTWPGLPHVVVSDGGGTVIWEGRLEDIAIVEGGVSLTAFGYQRAYRDVPYTALWSKSGSGDWKQVTTDQYTGAQPQLYEMDNNNRLYIAPRKGEQIRITANDQGLMTYAVPVGSSRTITNISFDYSILLPADWLVTIYTFADDFSGLYSDYSITATGSTQTGSVSETFAQPNYRVAVAVRNGTAGTATISGDTGDIYAKLTNIRLKTTTAATVKASAIVEGLETYVDSVNPLQASGSLAKIEAATTDLQDELYEDEYPADIMDRLALLHDYEWGVLHPRFLHFRPKGSAGQHWYVDATRIVNLQRSIEEMRNSVYVTYRAADGRRVRSDTGNDTNSQTRYAVVRRAVIDANTTSETEAETHRDVYLDDRADRATRAEIHFERLHTQSGEERPLYSIRAGDTITIRNLSPALSDAVDRIRTFVVGETEYDAATNEISITPDDPTPTLTRLVARREAGIR